MAKSDIRVGDSGGPWMRAVLASLEDLPTAVRTFDGDWSGAELLERMAGAAGFLRAAGPEGRPVPALVGSSADSIALALGGAFSNRPLAPLGTRLTVAELAPLVSGLGATALVADPANADLARRTAAAAGVQVLVADHFPALEPDFEATGPDSVVLVLHTSGTTGEPKAVMVKDSAVFHRAAAYQATMGLARGDLYCSTGGFHHTGGVGMLFVAAASGCGVVPFPRFTVESWRAVAALRPTCALLVPTMIDLLLEEGALGEVPLRALQYGTAPIHPQTLSGAMAAIPGTELAQAYGMTEGGPISVLTHDDHLRALAGEDHLLSSVGRPVAGLELRLEDQADDGVGEIVVRAPQIFQPGPDGWLRTGDLGRLDAEGFLYLEGRSGDTIIRGGENIYPLEVERVLEVHPQIREAAVIGVASRRWGQTVKAFIVATDPERPPEVALLAAYAAEHLAPFKIPADWEITESLPRNAAGKLLRRRLG